jgi:hypothetical protein
MFQGSYQARLETAQSNNSFLSNTLFGGDCGWCGGSNAYHIKLQKFSCEVCGLLELPQNAVLRDTLARRAYDQPVDDAISPFDLVSIGRGATALVGAGIKAASVIASKAASKLAKPGEDLFVGTYNQVRHGNLLSGLVDTHTPHHVVQNAVSRTTFGRGITINLRKEIHEMTGSYGIKRELPTIRDHLAADVKELRNLLRQNGHDRSTVNLQLQELIRQNKENLGGFEK